MTKVLLLVGRRTTPENAEMCKKVLGEVFPGHTIEDRTSNEWFDVEDLIKKSRPHRMVLCEASTITDNRLISEAVNILWFQSKGGHPDMLHHKDYRKVVHVLWQARRPVTRVELMADEFSPAFDQWTGEVEQRVVAQA